MSDEVSLICETFRVGADEGTRALAEFVSSRENVDAVGLPHSFLRSTVRALETNNWTEVGGAFVNGDFIGSDGDFLLIGPYKVVRGAAESVALTGIYGRALPVPPMPDFGDPIQALFGTEGVSVVEVVPFRSVCVFGHADGDEGEAFIVPDGWSFPASEKGPALNNMSAQQQRFEKNAEACLKRIFSDTSANLLLGPLSHSFTSTHLRHREFQFHEAGHAAGLGLRRKLTADLLRTTWYRGVEEWRADGVEFELLARMVAPEEAGRTIAANYCLRFGVDAHRRGGLERDTDVVAAMLTLNSLLRTRALEIDRDRKLSFRDATYKGLLRASVDHREDAVQLTRDELTLEFEQGVWGLYGSLAVERATRVFFDGLIRLPCSDLHIPYR